MHSSPDEEPCCSVVELRQYSTRPGQRDVLIEIFDNHLVQPQQDVGMHILGQFRDLDAPDAFVWLRGFRSLPGRRRALEDFYYGPVWRQHSVAANRTMVDSDDVLLLQPDDSTRAALHAPAAGPASIYTLLVGPPTGIDADRAATFGTLDVVNDFPALPVRTDFRGTVHLTAHDDESAARAHADAAVGAQQIRVLSPTAGSMLA
jgi:hypothetical protein